MKLTFTGNVVPAVTEPDDGEVTDAGVVKMPAGVGRKLMLAARFPELVIETELVEDEAVILLVASEQILKAFLPRRFLFLDGLDEIAVGAAVGCVLA